MGTHRPEAAILRLKLAATLPGPDGLMGYFANFSIGLSAWRVIE
jgi:hypothetical protein